MNKTFENAGKETTIYVSSGQFVMPVTMTQPQLSVEEQKENQRRQHALILERAAKSDAETRRRRLKLVTSPGF